MFGEMQPLEVEGRIEKLRGTVRRLGEIASRALGSDNKLDDELKRLLSGAEINLDILWCVLSYLNDKKELPEEKSSDKDETDDLAAQKCLEDIESLQENREY